MHVPTSPVVGLVIWAATYVDRVPVAKLIGPANAESPWASVVIGCVPSEVAPAPSTPFVQLDPVRKVTVKADDGVPLNRPARKR